MILSTPAGDGPSALLTWLWRWKFTLLVPVAAGIGLALAVHANSPKVYRSETVLVLDVRSQQVIPSESLIAPLPQENPAIKSELDIIRSRNLAQSALEILRSKGIEVRKSRISPGLVQGYVHSLISGILASLSRLSHHQVLASADVASDASQQQSSELETQRLEIDSLLSGLDVINDGHSYTIFIAYESEDPIYSAAVANAFGEAYLNHQVSIQEAATTRATDWLAPRVKSLRGQLQAAEQRLQAYRHNAGLLAEQGATMQVQRISVLNGQIASARAAVVQAKSKLESDDPSSEGSVPQVDSPVMQNLIAERYRLDRERARYEGQGAVRSAALADILANLATVDEQIRAESARIRNSLARDVETAQKWESLLTDELTQTELALDKAEKASVEDSQLERDVQTTSAIYESYLTRYKQAIEQEGVAVPEGRIVSEAEAGFANSTSRAAKLIMAGVALGGMLGLGGALLRSWRHDRTASPETVMDRTDLAIAGYLPRSRRLRVSRASADRGELAAEIHANLALLLGDRPAVAAVTSTVRGDGRTTLAIAVAKAAAASGAKVLLVDADLRSPNVARRLDLERLSGGQPEIEAPASLEDGLVCRRDPAFDILPVAEAGTLLPAVETGRGFAPRLQTLLRTYDLVVIDCPPLSEFGEAAQLVTRADLALVVVRPGASLLADLRWAVEQSAAVAPRMRAAVVFNRVKSGPIRMTGALRGGGWKIPGQCASAEGGEREQANGCRTS